MTMRTSVDRRKQSIPVERGFVKGNVDISADSGGDRHRGRKGDSSEWRREIFLRRETGEFKRLGSQQRRGRPPRLLVAMALAAVVLGVTQVASAADLESATFVPDLSVGADVGGSGVTVQDIERLQPAFVYRVTCTRDSRCRMKMEDAGGDVSEMPLVRSAPLREKVAATVRQAKEQGYPARGDKEYKPLESLRLVECWSTGDPQDAGSLCRFESPIGLPRWVVIWADMCSASCYSGFAPLYVAPRGNP